MLQNEQRAVPSTAGALQTVLKQFTCGDEPAVHQKLQQFAADGPETWHLVLDFDRTLTYPNGQGENFYTWTILQSFLPHEMQGAAADLYKQYRPLEVSGELTETLAAEWWDKSLKLLQSGNINLFEVEREFVSRASVRPGTLELFAFCQQHTIPIVILSAGITDVIEIWCRHHGITPDIILATRLKLTSEGRIAGWDTEGLVHARNKHERGHGELSALRVRRPNTILLGDSMDDADMVEGNNAVRARVYDPRPDEEDNAAAQTATLTRFDLMLAHGTLLPLAELMQEMAARTPTSRSAP